MGVAPSYLPTYALMSDCCPACTTALHHCTYSGSGSAPHLDVLRIPTKLHTTAITLAALRAPATPALRCMLCSCSLLQQLILRSLQLVMLQFGAHRVPAGQQARCNEAVLRPVRAQQRIQLRNAEQRQLPTPAAASAAGDMPSCSCVLLENCHCVGVLWPVSQVWPL